MVVLGIDIPDAKGRGLNVNIEESPEGVTEAFCQMSCDLLTSWELVFSENIHYFLLFYFHFSVNYMEVSEPKWVNPVLNSIEVNSLRLGGFHIGSMGIRN